MTPNEKPRPLGPGLDRSGSLLTCHGILPCVLVTIASRDVHPWHHVFLTLYPHRTRKTHQISLYELRGSISYVYLCNTYLLTGRQHRIVRARFILKLEPESPENQAKIPASVALS